jgi:thiamine pyrophosphate-dependent acetolactate synthase large subunit-like protein
MTTRTGGELIQDFLEACDIPFVFGNPGTTETTFLAAVAASKATYVLSLHESSAVGIAAGYALITGKPSVVSLHTYPGLANGMFNMRNALMAGVPLLVINGQQDSRFLIHNPVLGAPNVQLAQTATKYAYEVTRTDDLAVALQRCYLQERLQPTGPVFLSIPMNFMLDETRHITFKKTRIIEDAVPRAVGEVAGALKAVPAGKLAIVADYAVGAAHGIDAVSRIAGALSADIYAAPFHVQGTVDPLHPNFRGQLPPTTRSINEMLNRYHTMLLSGEKVDSFTYDRLLALPAELQVIQIAPAASQLGFDFLCDMAVLGDTSTPAWTRWPRSWAPGPGRSARGRWMRRLWMPGIPLPDHARAMRRSSPCCAISTGPPMSSPKDPPRMPSCRTWRSGWGSRTSFSRRAAAGWAGRCRSASASAWRRPSTPPASWVTAAACSRFLRWRRNTPSRPSSSDS